MSFSWDTVYIQKLKFNGQSVQKIRVETNGCTSGQSGTWSKKKTLFYSTFRAKLCCNAVWLSVKETVKINVFFLDQVPDCPLVHPFVSTLIFWTDWPLNFTALNRQLSPLLYWEWWMFAGIDCFSGQYIMIHSVQFNLQHKLFALHSGRTSVSGQQSSLSGCHTLDLQLMGDHCCW